MYNIQGVNDVSKCHMQEMWYTTQNYIDIINKLK